MSRSYGRYPKRKKDLGLSFGEAPSGQLTGTFEQLFEAGCIQTGADVHQTSLAAAAAGFPLILAAIQTSSGGNACDGCPAYRGGQCKAFQQYHTSAIEARIASKMNLQNSTCALGTKKYPGKSISQIAELLGVSKSEVRRRKLAGEI